jgi:uncharacterized protein YeaO (DUF488 family)
VPKAQFAKRNWYDVWLPILAPALDTMKLGLGASSASDWAKFARKYQAEMSRPDAKRSLELLAALSHATDFSVGCYCADQSRCHRSILKRLLIAHGAKVE